MKRLLPLLFLLPMGGCALHAPPEPLEVRSLTEQGPWYNSTRDSTTFVSPYGDLVSPSNVYGSWSR